MNVENDVTEYQELIESFGETGSSSRNNVVSLLKRLVDEEYWRSLDQEKFGELLLEGLWFYGFTSHEPLIRLLMPVYMHAIEKMPIEKRYEMQVSIRELVIGGKTSINALMPFLLIETEAFIVAGTTIDLTMLMKPLDDDPLSSPKAIISYLDAQMPTNMGAVFGGLVALGDHRVNSLLHKVKWTLSDNELDVAVKRGTGFPYVAAVEFWLDWLEELAANRLENTGLFGQCASGLSLLTKDMKTDQFAEVTRNFDYMHTEQEIEALTFDRFFTTREIGERYAERMYAIEEAESSPKLMSHVLQAYKLEPKALAEERYAIQ